MKPMKRKMLRCQLLSKKVNQLRMSKATRRKKSLELNPTRSSIVQPQGTSQSSASLLKTELV